MPHCNLYLSFNLIKLQWCQIPAQIPPELFRLLSALQSLVWGMMCVRGQQGKEEFCKPVLSVYKWFPWLFWEGCLSQLYSLWGKNGTSKPRIDRDELLAEPISPTLSCQLYFSFSFFFSPYVLGLFVFFSFRFLKIGLSHLEAPAHHHKCNYKAWVGKRQLNPDCLSPKIRWNRPHDCLPQQKPVRMRRFFVWSPGSTHSCVRPTVGNNAKV